MSTVTIADEGMAFNTDIDNPGFQLAALREQRGFSAEYVASKLHLRVCIIEMLERGDFHLLPQPVFIKGYLRGYAKLLGVTADPFIHTYTNHFDTAKKIEKVTLWQGKKESQKSEHMIRWFSLLFALGLIFSVGLWWQKNKELPQRTQLHSINEDHSVDFQNPTTETRVSDLSKVESLLSPQGITQPLMTPLETHGG